MKADFVRLIDVFPHFTLDEIPVIAPVARDVGRETRGEAVGEDVFRRDIDLDFIKGSPVHPLKLKYTKAPDSGSPLGRQTKNVILAALPASLALDVRLKREYVLLFEFGVIGDGWSGDEGTVEFAILAQGQTSGSSRTLFTRTIRPGENPLDRSWLGGRVDLSPYKGKSVKLQFNTGASHPPSPDRAAAWVNPVLAAKDAKSHRPNIILISADTLRPDHLGCYGYPRETTPALDRLAGESCRFERVVSQAPYTLSSHMSMLTSMYPSFHKVNRISADILDTKISTLAEVLYNGGYRTWAVTGGGQVSSDYGFAEGFESYHQFTSPEEDVKKKVDLTKEFLNENRGSPAFVFFHTYKPHPPFRPLPPYDTMFDPEYTGALKGDIPTIEAINKGEIQPSAADLDHLVALYDGDIREMDDQLGELFAYLERDRTDRDSIIVFTSDHGEEFGEHGLYGVHSHTLFQELMYVPLIVHIPWMSSPGGEVAGQVRSIDIYPTILELAGVKPPGAIQGKSLVPLLKGGNSGSASEPALSERIPADLPWMRSLRTVDYSYIFREGIMGGAAGHLFFDLRRDPTEQKALSIPDGRLRSLFNQVRFLVDEGKKPGKTRGEEELDPETLEILRSLGYLK